MDVTLTPNGKNKQFQLLQKPCRCGSLWEEGKVQYPDEIPLRIAVVTLAGRKSKLSTACMIITELQ